MTVEGGTAATKELSFSLEEYGARLAGVRERMRAAGLDLLLSHTPENLTYLSGYRTPGYYRYQCLAVPLDGEPALLTRRLEAYNVAVYSWFDRHATWTDTEDHVAATARLVADLGAEGRRVGVEKDSWFLPVRDFEGLAARMPTTTFVDASGIVEQGRLIKSPAEIALMRRAARHAETGMRAGLDAVAEGRTENDVGAAVAAAMALAGSEYAGLPQFFVSGARTLIPHATWTSRRMERGDPFFFELCGVVERYGCAMSRSGTIGEPSAQLARMAAAVEEALAGTLAIMRPGVTAHDVNAACQAILTQAGFPGVHGHRVAYSIGLNFPPDWGEGEIMSLQRGEERVLRPGMTFHVIPALFIPGVGATICTETVVVTETGVESLIDFERGYARR
ncbi:MAG: aminopeptidase P family protein [Chloroflexi bacterium]|nr:aminopeptidase P family protein [Chloroflexota bacterium]